MKKLQNKFHCQKCKKSSIMTIHTPVMKTQNENIIKESKIDFIEKICCLGCGKKIK